ncbi:hypothetical protein KDW_49810 [Dictyobacter vulcani]|uniref:HTH tetR-type domain-containing protein n=1 Tax=Dictyobacter vulcani TaxID=2607529 RepID=A0A5J4KXH4_9CHLR|nr:TetR/AcrR family transcriptional regulator [Dictyobacter vulcani]GER90819.1 hypothetical protein KDW_49810 [Dictyobacter vulcani]
MARIVNEAAHTARRNAILDVAQQAIITKGYEQMAIADLLSELRISSGAFYHYFDSKPALLMALVERLGKQIDQRLLPIVQDPTLNALDKLQRFFSALDQWKLSHKRLVFAYMRIWYADDNAIFRHKLYASKVQRLTPELEEIIRQGIQEDVFHTPYPEQTARMILSLFEDIGYATVELLLTEEHTPDDLPQLERITSATTDAIERLLGAPEHCLQRPWHEEISPWLVSPTEQQEEQVL